MRLLAIIFIAVASVSCSDRDAISKTTLMVIYPEVEMLGPARDRVEEARSATLRPILAAHCAAAALASRPAVAAQVTKSDIQYVRVTSVVQVHVTARTNAAALEAGRVIAAAALAAGSSAAPKGSMIELKLLDQPTLVDR